VKRAYIATPGRAAQESAFEHLERLLLLANSGSFGDG
jgi:hypothetical protein